jgi:hypothetical protein
VSHTPGPWTAHERETSHGHHRILVGPPGVNELRVALAWHWPDARLIASVPDLLAAAKRAYEFLGMTHLPDQESSVPGRTTCPVCVSLDIVRDAITKAEGET